MSAQISRRTDDAVAPLVMLPGTLCDARLFAPVLDLMGSRAHIPQISGAATMTAMAEHLLADLPDRLALCGFSLGAAVALEMAAQAPHRIDRLALIGCNPGLLSPQAAAARRQLNPRDFVASSYEHADPSIRALIEDMAEATSPDVYDHQTQVTLNRVDSRSRLAELTMPVLLMCGAEDRVCPPQLSIEMSRSIPHARLAIIDGAGHYVTLERPAAAANEISAWLGTPHATLH
jgi:pimeloyl-ACP methyl ester carboxylesterase